MGLLLNRKSWTIYRNTLKIFSQTFRESEPAACWDQGSSGKVDTDDWFALTQNPELSYHSIFSNIRSKCFILWIYIPKLMFSFSFAFTQLILKFDIFPWKQWVRGWRGWVWHATEEEEEGPNEEHEGAARKQSNFFPKSFHCINWIFVVRRMWCGGERKSYCTEGSHEDRAPEEWVQVPVLRQSKIDCLIIK